MKIQCKYCLPKDGIEPPAFSKEQKNHYQKLKVESPILATKSLMKDKHLSHRDAKYIVTHINTQFGYCNRCQFDQLKKENSTCPQCGSFNFNW